jgi:hypothetical protein
MDNILKIFSEVAEKEGIKIGTLERYIGASKGVISRAINNGSDVQSKWLQSLVEKYPQYNYQKMLSGDFSTSENYKPISINNEIAEGNSDYPDLKTVRDEIRGDLKLIFTGMTEKFETISDGVFHVLKDTQKLTKFIDDVDLTGLNDAGRNLKELIKERN